MKKPKLILLLFLLIFSSVCSACAQVKSSTKEYESAKYVLTYPSDWTLSTNGKTVSIYPKSEGGAVTISDYSGIDFPLPETRNFILELHELNDSPESVSVSESNGTFEFVHSFVNKANNQRWYTRVIRRTTDFFLVTINIDDGQWPKGKDDFLKVVNSFQIK